MKIQKSFSQRTEDVKRDWHIFDAKGQVLGRLAVTIAEKLIGKNKVTYTPHIDAGDYVVVINAAKVELTRGKEEKKIYFWHTGYPGGLKQEVFSKKLEQNPVWVIEKAVKNMLPKNKLQDKRMARLKVYADENHHHESQLKGKNGN